MARRVRTTFRRWATGLFDQQLWCWGRDVARPQGNVLCDLGMCRYRSSDPAQKATLYKVTLDEADEIWLWSFGLLYRAPSVGCVFVGRYGFEPLLVVRPPERPVHGPEALGGMLRPVNAAQLTTMQTLVRQVAAWIARYEHWVAESLGLEYRRAVLAARDRPPVVFASAMASSWERLAGKVYRLASERSPVDPWGQVLTTLRCRSEQPVCERDPSPTIQRGNPWQRRAKKHGPM